MPTLLEQRNALLADARKIVNGAKSAGRQMTAAEVKDVQSKIDEAEGLNAKIAAAKEGEDLLNRLGSLDPDGHHPDSGGPQQLDLSPLGIKRMASAIADKMVGFADGRKSILPAGETFISVPTIPSSPVTMGLVQNGFLSTLGVTKIPAGANARYLRETTRTNNAAAVAAGATKPTSIYGITPQDIVLKVYAHLSEPQDRFMLEDASELATFVANELLYGLFQAVEADSINGAAGGANILGVLQTSGIRVVAFATDVLTTTRKALADAQKLGYANDPVFVLSPDDWAAVDLAKASTSGTFLLNGAPQQLPTQTLWGVPVVTAVGLPASTAILFDRPAVSLFSDRQGVRIDWASPADQWSANLVTARCEGRFDLAVLQPAAVAKIATAAVGP